MQLVPDLMVRIFEMVCSGDPLYLCIKSYHLYCRYPRDPRPIRRSPACDHLSGLWRLEKLSLRLAPLVEERFCQWKHEILDERELRLTP